MYPTISFLDEILGVRSQHPYPLQIPGGVIRDPRAAAKLINAHKELEHRPLDSRAGDALIDAVRFFVHRHGTWNHAPNVVRSNRSPLHRARDYLITRMADAVPLGELSDVAGLSPFHLTRRFHEHFGLPPHQFQMNTRVERARTLLRRGYAPVDVAIACGFSDQAHLTRCFRRHVGTTPARYANSKNVQERLPNYD